MPSVKNPNGPSKNRLAARAATARKHSARQQVRKTQHQQQGSSNVKMARADARRGARAGILPTSGPNAALSAKKARKLERRVGHALRRQMEAEGEVVMKDISEETATKTKKQQQQQEQQKQQKTTAAEAMAVDADADDIS